MRLTYAISDEVHQAFTPKRSPLVEEDVILDFAGGITGIFGPKLGMTA
ncbi:VanZ family protein [Halalkalibacter alkalisediminis]|uniref:VanZ family protein n=1 Tax=Halalkalibacter alkalisediminis TaxID=935616 RepID=A0ABV6NF46_9BACI|nr:VanZ family protein [Halalkalibacter alkalisediminis]